MGMDAGTATITTVPTPVLWAPESCFCSPGWGASLCQYWVLPAWLWRPGGGPGWCWAGLGPHLTGSWGEQGWLSKRSCTPGPPLSQAVPVQPPCAGEEGRPKGGTCGVTVSSGYVGTQSSPQPDPQAPWDCHRRAGTLAAAASRRAAASPRLGPHPAPALGRPAGWAPAEIACTAPKSSCGEEWPVSGRKTLSPVPCISSPIPSCARGSLPGGELSKVPNNEKRLPDYWPFFQARCCPRVSWATHSGH